MKDRFIFIAYIGALILVTSIHDIGFLLAGLAAVILLAGRKLIRVTKKTVFAVAIFNSIVTVSYCIISIIQGNFSAFYVILINLRVFLLTFLTFLVGACINPFKVFGFSSMILYLLTLAYSQILTLRRLFEEFRLALKSRSPNPLSKKDLYRHGASTGAFFFHKSINDATEITQAMKSRGFFND